MRTLFYEIKYTSSATTANEKPTLKKHPLFELKILQMELYCVIIFRVGAWTVAIMKSIKIILNCEIGHDLYLPLHLAAGPLPKENLIPLLISFAIFSARPMAIPNAQSWPTQIILTTCERVWLYNRVKTLRFRI